jgi:hypothetical protein
MKIDGSTRCALWFVFAALVLFPRGIFVSEAAAAEEHDFTVTDRDGVYFGSGEHPASPASVRAEEVWAAIPEYKRIVEENLTDDNAEYHLLMKKASERFERALRTEARREAFDMVAEEGAVASNKGKEIPDATQDLVDLVSRD